MSANSWIFTGAVLAAMAVGLGALGAHGLEKFLEERDPKGNFETAVRYQMYHALAIIAVGLFARQNSSRMTQLAGLTMVLGVLLFSGGLFAIIVTGVKILGATVVPLGGVCFLIGWGALAFAAISQASR